MGKKRINVPIPVNEITSNHEGANGVRRIPGGRGGTLTPFTPETSRIAARAREQKRIELYAKGAGLAVQDTQLIEQYGEDAHIVERGRTLQYIASTPEAGKAAVMAAAQLDKAQGLVAERGADAGAGAVDNTVILLRELAQFAGLLPVPADVVDAESVDVEA